MNRLRSLWQSWWLDVDRRVRLGRILGLVFIASGFIVIGKAWDGSANLVRVDSQFPYLLSGGFLGLGLIVTGAVMLVLAAVRDERQALTERLDEVATLLGRNLSRLQLSSNGSATDGQVVAGAGVYHRAECRVLEGKSGLTTVTIEQAAAEGLEPCRVCRPSPPPPSEKPSETVSATTGETPTR
jgi:hypothetical protein